MGIYAYFKNVRLQFYFVANHRKIQKEVLETMSMHKARLRIGSIPCWSM